nr:hypothetical protein [Spirochaetia bacterium]
MRGGRQALAMLFFLGGAAGLGATGLEAAVVWSGTEGRFAPLWLSAADPPPGSFLELVELAEDSAVLGVDSVPAGFGAPALFLARQGGRYAARLRYGERILAETPVAWPSDAWRGHVILAVGLERASAASLENALLPAEPVRVVTIRPDELPPSALALDGISAVAITDTELTQAQRAALASWVVSGGSLALFGSGAGSLSAEFPAVSDNPTAYGLGRVRVSPGQPEPGLAADGSWGRYLGLDSYERSRRPDVWNDASPALGWGSSLEDASSISGATLVVLMAWAAGLVLVLFLKKRW